MVEDIELETLIDQRTATLVRQLDAGGGDMRMGGGSVRTQVAVQFFEKKRRKGWFGKGEEEICWEAWTLNVTLATPRTESGKSCCCCDYCCCCPLTWRGRSLEYSESGFLLRSSFYS